MNFSRRSLTSSETLWHTFANGVFMSFLPYDDQLKQSGTDKHLTPGYMPPGRMLLYHVKILNVIQMEWVN